MQNNWDRNIMFMCVIERKDEQAGNVINCNLLHIDKQIKYGFGFYFNIWMHVCVFETNSKW